MTEFFSYSKEHGYESHQSELAYGTLDSNGTISNLTVQLVYSIRR